MAGRTERVCSLRAYCVKKIRSEEESVKPICFNDSESREVAWLEFDDMLKMLAKHIDKPFVELWRRNGDYTDNEYLHEFLDEVLREVIISENMELIRYFMDHKLITYRPRNVIVSGENMELIKHFADRGWINEFDIGEAARRNLVELIKYLSSRGFNYDDVGMGGAAEGGHLELVKYFAERGATNWAWSISQASIYDNRDIIEYLIEKAGDNSCLEYGLLSAIQNNHLNLAKYYVSIEPNMENYRYSNIFLHKAALTGNRELYEFVEGLNVIHPGSYSYSICNAVCSGNMDLIEYILSKDIIDPDNGLRGAVRSQRYNLVEYFIDKGANDWNSALREAVRNNDIDMMQYFAERGANDWNGALRWSFMPFQCPSLEVVKYIVEHGATNVDPLTDFMEGSIYFDVIDYINTIIDKN